MRYCILDENRRLIPCLPEVWKQWIEQENNYLLESYQDDDRIFCVLLVFYGFSANGEGMFMVTANCDRMEDQLRVLNYDDAIDLYRKCIEYLNSLKQTTIVMLEKVRSDVKANREH